MYTPFLFHYLKFLHCFIWTFSAFNYFPDEKENIAVLIKRREIIYKDLLASGADEFVIIVDGKSFERE